MGLIHWTDEELDRIRELNDMIRELQFSMSADAPQNEEDQKIYDAMMNLVGERSKIQETARVRSLDAIENKTPELVLSLIINDLQNIVDETCEGMRAEDEADPETGLLDPRVVNMIVQVELEPFLEYLYQNSEGNEYIDALNYLENLLSDPSQFINVPLYPEGDSYASVTTTLSTVPTDAPARPTHLISPTDNVSNYTFKPRPTIDLPSKEVPTYRGFTTVLSVEFENDGAVSIGGASKLTAFDRFVHDAICTLFITDNPNMEPRNITPAMIYRVIAGKPGSRLPPKQSRQIEETIEKLRRTNISIRESDEKAVNMQEISSHLISGMFGRRTFFGHTATVLRVTEVPILFSYASTKKQISRAPIDLFRIEGVSNYSTDFILVMQYLWRRISAMKSSSSLSRVIRFDAIYENVDLASSDMKPSALANKKKAIRDHARTILDSWIQNQGFIYGYTMKMKGREYVSVEIVPTKPKSLE